MQRSTGRLRLALLATLATISHTAARAETSLLELMRNDAELADVCFVNERQGWAVGDRGVIWHTQDGGRTWKLQESHVRCRLQSVTFLDEQNGWVAGGWTQAHTHIPRGVVLRTRDGGKTWTPQRQALLPTLYGIKFFDKQQGVAFGRPSALFPSGVFTSDNGGASWAAVPAEQGRAWPAADFVDPHTGALASRDGIWATLRNRKLNMVAQGGAGLRTLHRMQLTGPAGGWMVGDGGLVFTTSDLGTSWQTAAPLPDGAAEHFDLCALASNDQQCWAAGTPGSRVFHTADGGQSWAAYPTGSAVPLKALCFAPDQQHGWAVGALGTILHTADGGRTWKQQRSGGARAAALGFYSDPENVPLELFAQLAAADGYLSIVDILGRRDLDPQSDPAADWPQRTHEALVEVGACGAEASWRFPLRQQGILLSVDHLVQMLDRIYDGRGLQMLESHAVRQIRTWRPEVVFTHHASPRGNDPLGHLVNQLVLRAVEKAADPTSYVELTTVAGLEPWRVRKVYGTLGRGESGTTNFETARLEPRLGSSTADHAADARGLISRDYAPPPPLLGFRLLVDHIPQNRGERDFFAGIALTPGGDARRKITEAPAETLDQLRRMAQKRRNMQAIIERSEGQPQVSDAWLGQVGELARGLDAGSACQVLYQLGQQYYRTGRWDMAAGAFEALVDRHPEHPLAQSAQVWLIQYYASGEAAWRFERAARITVRQVGATLPGDSQGEAQSGPQDGPALAADLPSQTAMQVQGLVHNQPVTDERLKNASELGKQLERAQPDLFAEPSLRFSLASAHRKQGFGNQADRFFLAFRRSRTEDAWWRAAMGEAWLAEPKGDPPKSLWIAKATADKPHLDGRLDEPFWQTARSVELRSALRDDGSWPAEARLAYDSEFLYLAAVCRKAPGASYPPPLDKRSRDPDLSQHDRIELLIDIDRDYATYYHFTIDHRGQTGEACWGDKSWNPRWYVASDRSDDQWTVEVAIPLSELTGLPPQPGHTWAVGVQRTVPNVGFQSWTQPAAAQVAPEGFGYLMFR